MLPIAGTMSLLYGELSDQKGRWHCGVFLDFTITCIVTGFYVTINSEVRRSD